VFIIMGGWLLEKIIVMGDWLLEREEHRTLKRSSSGTFVQSSGSFKSSEVPSPSSDPIKCRIALNSPLVGSRMFAVGNQPVSNEIPVSSVSLDVWVVGEVGPWVLCFSSLAPMIVPSVLCHD
jgi:hypothetical protein